MQTIYNFDYNRIFTSITKVIEDDEGAPFGWTFEAPPVIPDGKFATFLGPEWLILDEYPVDPLPVEAAPVPRTQNPNPDEVMVL